MPDLLEFGTVPFDQLLPDHLRHALGEVSVSRHYVDGEMIHGRGDRKPGLSIVRSGAVRMCNFGADGSVITTAVLGPGQIFGEFTLLTDLPRTHDAVAVGRVAVDQVGRAAYEALVSREPGLLRILAEATARRLHAVLELLDDIRRLPLPVLTAKLLLGMARVSTQPGVIHCNHSDLAVTIGVSRVSIGKTLKQLQSAGLLEQRYGRIEIADSAALENWIAERDYLFRIDAPALQVERAR